MKAVIEPEVRPDGRVTVNMGPARKAPEVLPFVPEGLESGTEGASRIYHAHLSCSDVWFSALSMGNPHAVIRVEDVDAASVAEVGPRMEYFSAFPARVNVGFLQVVSRTRGKLRVWERGAGETLACGTGACATAVAAILGGYVDHRVTVHLLGGDLQISWSCKAQDIFMMTGPSTTVFSGKIDL